MKIQCFDLKICELSGFMVILLCKTSYIFFYYHYCFKIKLALKFYYSIVKFFILQFSNFFIVENKFELFVILQIKEYHLLDNISLVVIFERFV